MVQYKAGKSLLDHFSPSKVLPEAKTQLTYCSHNSTINTDAR